MLQWLDKIAWAPLLVVCATLGLSPFAPPHVWEKLQMLAAGELTRAIDWFDLVMHGAPWAVLFLKIGAALGPKRPGPPHLNARDHA